MPRKCGMRRVWGCGMRSGGAVRVRADSEQIFFANFLFINILLSIFRNTQKFVPRKIAVNSNRAI